MIKTIKAFAIGTLAAAMAAGPSSAVEPLEVASLNLRGTQHPPIRRDMLGDLNLASFGVEKLGKWQRVYGRYRSQTATNVPAQWKEAVQKLRGAPLDTAVKEVNRLINRASYSPDTSNWGQIDYWSTPKELFSRGGDCEDYAIAKYLLLRDIGVSDARLRVLILAPSADQIGHAVLVVDTDTGPVVLDNNRKGVYRLNSGMLKRVTYAFNSRTWWVSLGSRRTVTAGR